MNQIVERLAEKFKEHADRVYPEEACGLVILKDHYSEYVPCENVCNGNKLLDFEISEQDSEEYAGNILAVFHSHTNGNPTLTSSDKAFSEATRTPYIMYCVQSGSFDWYRPDGSIPPLLERPYVGGSQDCYGLVRDYYSLNLKVSLPDFYREDKWWAKGKDYIHKQTFLEAGFVEVYPEELQKHDVVVMNFSGINDHLGVFLGDERFLHHAYNRLSKEDFFAGSWKKAWTTTLRYKRG